MKRSTIAKTLVIATVSALALGMAPTAKANDKGCSNATLKGTFAHRASGFETAPPAIAGPLVGVGTDTFDGHGGVTSTATLSLNGNIVPVTATGTYEVNPDCTGTYKLPGTTLTFVIADSGNEIQAICIDPGGHPYPHLPEAISSGRLETVRASRLSSGADRPGNIAVTRAAGLE